MDEIDDDSLLRRRVRLLGPAAQARELAQATARLAARRQRDALPHRIDTLRLVLRAPIRGDVPDLVKLADNRRIHEVLARLPHPYTRADAIAFVEILAQRDDERPYAITLHGQFIGVVGFTFRAGEPPELGYWLGEPHWGKGFMSEAVKGLLEAAFATRLFPRIKSRALSSNAGSLNVLRKAGFVRLHEDIETIGTGAGKPTTYFTLEQPKWS
jgi:RimJ/RimL family protein N-acetyltransferase